MNAEVLQYVVFGSSILICLIPFTFSEKLAERSFFNKCAVAAAIYSIIGMILEATNFFDLETGMTFVVMSVATIFLLYFSILLWIFKKLKGFDPYITTPSSRIGDPTVCRINGKYKLGRPIIWEDFVFSMLQALLPMLTVFLLVAYFAGRL